MAADVAVLVVTHYSADVLASCLDSIPASSTTPTPIVVVDNDTADGSVAEVVVGRSGVRLLQTGGNYGYGGAIDRAVAGLGPEIEWILITNPDTVLHEGVIDTLREAGRADPTIGAIGPRILNLDGTIYPSAREIPSIRIGVGHALFGRIWPRNPWTERYLRGELAMRGDAPADVGWLSGACLLVRRESFEQIGGFDPAFFMYFEDVDLGTRLGEAGWRNLYLPSASVEHVGGTSTRRYSRRMLIAHHRSAYIYLAKRYRAWYYWPVRLALRAGLSVRSHVSR